ncbi:MAG: CoA-binding protein [Candidatus Anstonellaceae archaeon]
MNKEEKPSNICLPTREYLPGEKEIIKKILGMKRVAIVGISDKQDRPSFHVASYLASQGYEVVPINPNLQEWMGKKSYPELAAVPHQIDVVDVFRKPEAVPPLVHEAIRVGAKAVWLQEEVISPQAQTIAKQAGIFFVMDRCMMKEHMRLKAEI